ncbi:DUF2127 domain-containing protein [Candidatus Saccharibacteria bacterium]|nr:DUF2127 domain-containing protein [Candidatus Saccharibacteria bacterium]
MSEPVAEAPISNSEARIKRLFYISLIIKGVDAVLQLVGGVLLLTLRSTQVDSAVRFLADHSYGGDLDDALFRHASGYLSHLTGGTIRFVAIYIIVDALLKLILIHEIFHKRYWAYIGLISILSVLVVYQTYRIILNHSVILMVLTAFDLVIIYLSAHEYRRHMMAVH